MADSSTPIPGEEWQAQHRADTTYWSEWAERFPDGMVPVPAFVALRDALRTAEAEAARWARNTGVQLQAREEAEAEVVRLRAALERIATSNWDEIGTPSIAAVRAFAADSLTATNRCPVCGSTERAVRRGVLMGASSLDGADPCDSAWHDGRVGEITPEPERCLRCGSTDRAVRDQVVSERYDEGIILCPDDAWHGEEQSDGTQSDRTGS